MPSRSTAVNQEWNLREKEIMSLPCFKCWLIVLLTVVLKISNCFWTRNKESLLLYYTERCGFQCRRSSFVHMSFFASNTIFSPLSTATIYVTRLSSDKIAKEGKNATTSTAPLELSYTNNLVLDVADKIDVQSVADKNVLLPCTYPS